MKKIVKHSGLFLLTLLLAALNLSCEEKINAAAPSEAISSNFTNEIVKSKPIPLSSEFKSYWYAGDAEITSFELEQARYGEIRKGKAVQVFVTEPFLAVEQVKANRNREGNIPVLKLNATKKYLTGIYPYSIMTSSFYPVANNQHAIKVANSVQEWCGQVYMQLNNREQFEIKSHSYFEGEADRDVTLDKSILEDELWNQLRINPQSLPVGKFKAIPSFEYLRTGHSKIRNYDAEAELTSGEEQSFYTLKYPELNRSLTIYFSSSFPYSIEGWTESFKSGFGPDAKVLTSKATKINSLKTPYWQQNGNNDLYLRDQLGI